MTLRTLLALAFLCGAAAPTSSMADPVNKSTSAMDSLSLTSLAGTKFDTAALQGKVVMFVNVASRCGYTKQYDGLQALYADKKDAGLVIVGVPSNQFGGQEPGSAEEIATFCRMNYGVEFPLLEKQDVKGATRSPLYSWLVSSEKGAGKDVSWNFEKFIVDRSGAVVARFPSSVTPRSSELVGAIEAAL